MSFESVYREHFDSLFRYLHRSLGDAALAEDLTQETFVRYLLSLVPEAQARPWLFRVGSNLVRDHGRRARQQSRLVHRWRWMREESVDPLAAERGMRAERVRGALERLDERDRVMLLMREEGFTYREIAETVGVASTSVGALLVRALDRFRSEYGAE